MTQNQLNNVMKFHMSNFNDEKVTISDDTKPEEVLSDSDGFGASNSKNLFRGMVRWTIKKAGHADKKWPNDWMKISIKELASRLIILFLMLAPFISQSQLQVTAGAARSDLKNGVIVIAVNYLAQLDSVWAEQDYLLAGKRLFWLITPDAQIEAGTQDAFSSLALKVTGLLVTFKTTTIDGVETPNSARTFHTFPISLGAEANNPFSTVNAVAEVGWVPWYQAETRDIADFIKRTKVGFFAQAGYKFRRGDSTASGLPDASLEAAKELILRFKGSAIISSGAIITVNQFKLGLEGRATVWYDARNGATYHRLDGKGRFFLTGANYIDLFYQSGSGAPNFNTGDQYGVALTVTF